MSIESTKVLFVEDSEEDYITIQRAFKKANVKNNMHRVKNGDEAIDYLYGEGNFSDRAKYPLPGLILLDLNLPGLSGKEVLKKIKQDGKLKRIPVIILTTSNDEKDIESCYSDGANSYMQKPIEFIGFVEAISRLKNYWFEISILPKV